MCSSEIALEPRRRNNKDTMGLRTIIRDLTPEPLLNFYRYLWKSHVNREYESLTAAQVFSTVYEQNKWGGAPGVAYSGWGSTDPKIVDSYVAALSQWISDRPVGGRRLVDLGCGDFRVGRQLVDVCEAYVGVDVVPALIDSLRQQRWPPKVSFRCLDIATDELPGGDIATVRQVFQHLSNEQIAHVLRKLRQFAWVIVTEHYPTPEFFRGPNVDIRHGPATRLGRRSAVCLDAPPFNVEGAAIEHLLDLAARPEDTGDPIPGIIRTIAFPGRAIPQ
jgi:hypothetical protein